MKIITNNYTEWAVALILIFSPVIFFIGCGTEKAPTKINAGQASKSTPPAKVLSVSDFMSDLHNFDWDARKAGSSAHSIRLTLHKDSVTYQYQPRCVYYYPIHKVGRVADIFWDYKTDCSADISFLKKSHDIKPYPKKGDLFATYAVVNDSTIKAKYYFDRWVGKINEIAGDSLFPTYLYLRK